MEKAIREKWSRYSHRIRDTKWLYVIPAFAIFLDIYIFVIPSDLIFVLSLATAPKKWRRLVLACAAGATASLLLLYHLMGIGPVEHYMANLATEWAWGNSQAATFFNKFGAISLVLVGVTPFPPQVPVMLSALSGIPWWQVLIGIALGRLARYGLYTAAVLSGKKAWWNLTHPEDPDSIPRKEPDDPTDPATPAPSDSGLPKR